MNPFSRALLPLACLGFAVAQAAPLREADLAPDTAWFVHLDLEAVRAVPKGAAVLEKITAAAGHPLARLQTEIGAGFHAAQALDSITAHGTGVAGEGAILLRHHAGNTALQTWLDARNYAKTSLADGTASYVISTRPDLPVLLTFPRDGVIVLGTGNASLEAATARLDAVDSAAKFPAEYRRIAAGQPFLVGATDGGLIHEKNPRLTRLRDFQSGAVALDATGDLLRLRAETRLRDAASAQKTADQIAKSRPAGIALQASAVDDTLRMTGTVPWQTLLDQLDTHRAARAKAAPPAATAAP